MMRHVLMDPAFPDLVADWAGSHEMSAETYECANDNGTKSANDVADPLLTRLAELEIAATRLW